MNNSYSISVIVPVYNVEKYLEECLDSLVLQTESFDEIILVNDGSTDNSLLICERYFEKYPNIQIFNQENKGQAVARNLAMKHAKGEYIVFVDADDYVSFDTVSVLKRKLQEETVDVLFYAAKKRYETKTSIKEKYEREEYLCKGVMPAKALLEDFPKYYIESPCVGAYKRTFLDEYNITFPEKVLYEDLVFLLKVYIFASKVTCITDHLYTRRYRADSTVVGKANEKKCEDMIAVQLMQWDILDLYDKNEVRFIRRFVVWGLTKVIFMLAELGENKEVRNERILIEQFFKKWWNLFTYEETGWAEKGILLYMLKEIKKYEECIIKFFGNIGRFDEVYGIAEKNFDNEIKNMLEDIALNDSSKKIAIYGIGEHTSKLVELYELYYGEITCELIFVVTELQENAIYKGRTLVACHAIPEDVDMIVVSSLFYQDEMLNELRKLDIPEEKVKVLYDNDAIYDLVMAWKIRNI